MTPISPKITEKRKKEGKGARAREKRLAVFTLWTLEIAYLGRHGFQKIQRDI